MTLENLRALASGRIPYANLATPVGRGKPLPRGRPGRAQHVVFVALAAELRSASLRVPKADDRVAAATDKELTVRTEQKNDMLRQCTFK